jgi:hypothetical protein
MKVSIKKYLPVLVLTLSNLYLFAQNVVDSDLSNNAGTNKNFKAGWWLFALIGVVLLSFYIAYHRRKKRKI